MDELLCMRGVTKRYGNGILANDRADFSLREGEIHAVAGENGAGKSTLMKILAGAERPDAGDIILRGKQLAFASPRDAARQGIGLVYQHFMLVDELPVYQNIFLGVEKTSRAGVLRKKRMLDETLSLCEKYDMPLDPLAPCGQLPVGARQKVEILKVIARGAQVLILDEPTAVLTPQETQQLFEQLRRLRQDRHTIVIITHKLKEIKELCDRVTVMRAGRTVGVYHVADVSEREISELMVGGNISAPENARAASPGETRVAFSSVTLPSAGRPALRDVTFTARAGEIVCLAGVEGNGQRQAVDCLTGAEGAYTGSVRVLGLEAKEAGVRRVRRAGLSHIPEDRMTTGTNQRASLYENLISLTFDTGARCGLIARKALRRQGEAQLSAFAVKGALDMPISMLSGGNMQKVVAARELSGAPRVVVANQPTRGVDVGAMAFIHGQLLRLRDAGCCVVLVSADLGEVFALADRILVFHNGEITASITDVQSVSERQLGRYMLGVDRMEAPS